MRGRCSGAMPAPGVAYRDDGRAVVAARPDRDAPRSGLYLIALSSRLAKTCRRRSRSPLTSMGSPASERRRRRRGRLGDVLVELDDLGQQRTERHRLAWQLHHAGFGLGNVHQRVEDREDPLGLLEAVGQRFALRVRARHRRRRRALRARARPPRAGGRSGVRRSCATLSSASPIAPISVLIRSSMPLNRPLNWSTASPSTSRAGTRVSVRPVRMMFCTTSMRS